MTRTPDTPVPDPILYEDGKATQTSRQVKEHLLCRSCEDRFGRREDVVRRLTVGADGGFPLRDNLARSADFVVDGGVRAGVLVGVDTDAIMFFALSILWRRQVSAENHGSVRLGPYEEVLRQYLLNDLPLPNSVAVLLTVAAAPASDRRRFDRTNSFPYPTRKEAGCHWYRMIICGLVLEIAIGKVLPEYARLLSLSYPGEKWAFLMPVEETGAFKDFAGVMLAAKRSPRLQQRLGDLKASRGRG